jgi:glyoxylase-like metal-dependent hydrolase (beta-lactamase superfamily II)
MSIQVDPEFVSSRRIGDAMVTVIREGWFGAIPLVSWLKAPEEVARQLMPHADAKGNVAFDFNAAHIRLGDASILIDPGWGDLDPDSPLGKYYAEELRVRQTAGIVAGLASIGITPEQITHVIITHTDEDHFLGATVERDGQLVPLYPRARHLLMRHGWNEIPDRAKADSPTALCLGALEREGLLDLVEDNHVVAPGVIMLHTPGESANHSIVRVQSAGRTFYYLGDLIHDAFEFNHPDLFFEWHDEDAIRGSRARFLAEPALSEAVLAYTHRDFPAWGRLVSSEAGYLWEAL